MSPTDFRYLPEVASKLRRSAAPRASSRRPAPLLVALLVAGTLPMALPAPTEAGSCRPHATPTSMPRIIRVKMARTGHVRRVPFVRYVETVLMSEWRNVPPQLMRAGAVVAKQYAWERALHPRRSAQGCFDVWSSTRDQIFRPQPITSPIRWAVRTSWHISVRGRGGALMSTGYRTGSVGRCAHDAGNRLYARSARRCAWQGWSAAQILRAYYRDRGGRVRR